MASKFLVIRLIPTQPVDPNSFRATLQHLTVTVFDKSVRDTQSNTNLGSASMLAALPPVGATPSDIPVLTIDQNPTRISPNLIQHFKPGPGDSLLSVATAIII